MAERRSGGTPPSSTSTSRSGGVRRAMWIAGLGLTGLLAGCSAGGGEESGGIHGGEASLVLPDFTSVSFFGMQGNHLLMIGLLLAKPVLGLGPTAVLGAATRPAIAALVMAVVVALVGRATEGALPLALDLALRVALGAIAYPLVLWIIARPLCREVLALLPLPARLRPA